MENREKQHNECGKKTKMKEEEEVYRKTEAEQKPKQKQRHKIIKLKA